jgi:cytoskeletal protein CcmA (bactofilin family)
MLWRTRGSKVQQLAANDRTPAPQPEPSFLAPASLRTSLGPDTIVTGRLSFTTPTRLDGKLRGEVNASDVLVIGETGVVDGTVRGKSVVVLGSVDGSVIAADRIEIGPRGRVKGSIETRELTVQEGGKLDGDCRISPGRATVHVLRPRGATEPANDPGNASAAAGPSD